MIWLEWLQTIKVILIGSKGSDFNAIAQGIFFESKLILPVTSQFGPLATESSLFKKISNFASIFKSKTQAISIGGVTYVPTQKLGKGGFGHVVEAHSVEDPTKIVVIKTFFKKNKPSKESFDQEVAALKHFRQWIASDRKKLMIVMEKVPGKSLDKVIDGKMTESEIESLRGLYLDTIRRFHSQGLIHGDIRPGNVMYHNGKMELIDFGNTIRNKGTDAEKAHKFFLDELEGREAFDQFVYLQNEKHL